MIARRSVWTDPKVLELAAKFIPAADEVHRLQNRGDAECRLFQKFADQGHYGGRPGTTRQGTYAVAPSGVLLASINSNDPVRMEEMLRRALAKWDTLPRAERLLTEDPQGQVSTLERAERFYPEDGLALHVYSRDLPRENQATDWRGKAWNQDYAWFTKEEARQLVPRQLQVGEKQEAPDALIRRIVRCHLVDNVRGQTWPYDEGNVEKAKLILEVIAREGSVVALRLAGETRASAEGTWSVRGLRDPAPTPQKRGFEARLLGKATYDVTKQRFLTFEMLALGTRWGGTQFNVRGDDLDPAPIGILLTLAGNSPSERIAPAFFRAY